MDPHILLAKFTEKLEGLRQSQQQPPSQPISQPNSDISSPPADQPAMQPMRKCQSVIILDDQPCYQFQEAEKPAAREQQSPHNPLIANPDRQPYTYMIDNILTLLPYISPQILKLHLAQLQQTHSLPQTKLLTLLAIELTIQQFHKIHCISYTPQPRYILSQLERILPSTICQLGLSNLLVIRRVMDGLMARFRVETDYACNGTWLRNVLRKEKQMLRDAGIQMARLGDEDWLEYEERVDREVDVWRGLYGFTTLKEYMKRNMEALYRRLQLESEDGQELLWDSFRAGTRTNLKYYKTLQSNLAQQSQSQSQLSPKPKRPRKKNKEPLTFQASKYKQLQCEILKRRVQKPVHLMEDQVDVDADAKVGGGKDSGESEWGLGEACRVVREYRSKRIAGNAAKFSFNYAQLGSGSPHSSSQPDKPPKKAKTAQKTPVQHLPQPKPQPKPILIQLQPQPSTQPASQQVFQKMQKILYSFYLREPQFTMQSLLAEISRILGKQLHVPVEFHERISQAWLEKYRTLSSSPPTPDRSQPTAKSLLNSKSTVPQAEQSKSSPYRRAGLLYP